MAEERFTTTTTTQEEEEESELTEGSLSLDHALLESLFYNEMMLMDESSLLSSQPQSSPLLLSPTDFLSYIAGGGGGGTSDNTTAARLLQPQQEQQQEQQQQHLSSFTTTTTTTTSSDPSTLVERDLLRDFGVSSLPTSESTSSTWPGMLLTQPQPQQQQHTMSPFDFNNTYTTTATPTVPTVGESNVRTPGPFSTTAVAVNSNYYYHPSSSPSTAAITTTTTTAAVSQERAKQLVSQFATLAARLGIELPHNVLQSLVVAATNSETLSHPTAATTLATTTPFHAADTRNSIDTQGVFRSQEEQVATSTATTSAASAAASAVGYHPSIVIPPSIVAAASPRIASPNSSPAEATPGVTSLPASPLKTAEAVLSRSISAPMLHEAMAAVSLKRTWSGEDNNRNSSSSNTNNITASASVTSNNSVDGQQQLQQQQQQPPLAKRRKKANLSECEARLAALKAENEMLKRHLHNVSNQTHKIDQERKNTSAEMRRLLAQGATPEQIDAVVDKFSETYSDYGRHRHEELSFHLDQLQRLATPSNFTKMGLWTLGQTGSNGKNPLAGILQRDLGITPQQGRKILDQRQKIQHVCANLKECLALLAKLKTLCQQKTGIFHDRMNKAREILNPMQVVRLLIWIDEHSSLLAHLCPGWGSEHIVLEKTNKKQQTIVIDHDNSTTTRNNSSGTIQT